MLVKLCLTLQIATLFFGGGDNYLSTALPIAPKVQLISPRIQIQQPQTTDSETNLLRQAVRQEVQRTFRITAPILNTWLVILLMSSTATVVALCLRCAQLAWQAKICSQEIEGLKYDTISHIYCLASDAETVFQQIKENLEISQEKLTFINSESAVETDERFEEETRVEHRS